MPRLSESEIARSLKELTGWSREGDAFVRNFEFKDFAAALAFVNRVAALAESANHHPDIDIRYNKVRLLLTSHDSGGITERDVRLARQVSRL